MSDFVAFILIKNSFVTYIVLSDINHPQAIHPWLKKGSTQSPPQKIRWIFFFLSQNGRMLLGRFISLTYHEYGITDYNISFELR